MIKVTQRATSYNKQVSGFALLVQILYWGLQMPDIIRKPEALLRKMLLWLDVLW